MTLKQKTLIALSLPLILQGCVAGMALGAAGDIVEGTAKATVFTAKTAGKVAGAVIPGGGDNDDKLDEE